MADLYARVRRESIGDPERAWSSWRSEREQLFRQHPQSPVPVAGRARFAARHWPYNPDYRFEVPVHAVASDEPSGPTLDLAISTGGVETFSRIGWVELPFPGGTRRLGVYWMAGYAGGLFLPFRDTTNGHETYGAGRYLLDGAKSADLGPGPAAGTLALDFNFSFHPSCAFDPRWSCPLAPTENRLDIPVPAGERLT